jgi:hypothetical protein
VRSVPADVAAAYFLAGEDKARPPGDARSTLALAGFLVDRASETGFLSHVDTTARAWLDALAAVSVVLEYPHAVAVFDFALIIRTHDGVNGKIERRIQHLLNVFTNDEHSKITRRSREGEVRDGLENPPQTLAGGVVFSLRDRRLPSWAVIKWGAVGEYYVVGFGDGSFRRVADAVDDAKLSLGANRWFQQAFAKAGGGRASVVAYVRFDRLRQEGDASLANKIRRVQSSLQLAGVERGFWTFGYDGRAVEANGFVLRPGRDELVPIAGTRFLSAIGGSVIPDRASRYAVIDCNPPTVLRGFRDAYLASRSPVAQEKSRTFWRGMEAGAGVAIEQDIFSHLTRPVVIHDDPRHALRLPFMWTILFRIDGDPDILRRNIDKLLAFAQMEYGDACTIPLHRDAEGMWYSHLGIIAPALAVTDRWVIISHSPGAVRRNIEFLSRIANGK